MLVGYFDLFVIFAILLAWSALLGGRPGAPVWVRRWPWIVGTLFALCVMGGAMGLYAALSTPPTPVGEVPEPVPLVQLGMYARYGSHVVLAAGALWLVLLTVQTVTSPAPPPDPKT